MKKCPSCDKTYEDSLRFCQADGTPLVDDAPPLDLYKTIVARPINISEDEPKAFQPPPAQASAPRIEEPEELLDLPDADPLKTMYISDDEMRQAMKGSADSGELQMEIPSTAAPQPPKFIEQEIPSPKFGDLSPVVPAAPESAPTPPIPSPFDVAPSATVFSDPVRPEPSYNEAATVIQDFPPASPFNSPEPSFVSTPEPSYEPEPPAAEPTSREPERYQPAAVSPFQKENSPAAWTPPPAPEASWQNQEIGQNTPFLPPAAGVGAQSKGLAIGSLVSGILSLLCCVSVVTGPIAVILGYLARKKAVDDPHNYGGQGLALAGMVTGAIGFVVGVILIVLQVFFGILNNLTR